VAIAVALFINFLLQKLFSRLARLITKQAENSTRGDQLIQIKRTETVLSVISAITKAFIFIFCLYAAWRFTNPTSAPVALIGASAFFVVLGAATIGPLLRDFTAGILMITERWYNIGDHIVIDPFWNLSGVVEKINLRSTKLRSLSGEVAWVHNQYIQAVRVTPRGVRTISIDIFVSDLAKGRKLISRVIQDMPTGPAMIAQPLFIADEEELGRVWRIMITGQTSPGREWLIEDFAVKALTQADEKLDEGIIIYGPIVRYTDPAAEKRFMRSMNAKARNTSQA
jgi:hypothetical protein